MEDARQMRSNITVLMLPWLAHGHIFPFLELAKKLTHRNFHIYFCSSPIILNSLKPKLSDHPNYYSTSIELVELHLPSLPDLPPHYHTIKGLPPHLFPTFYSAVDMARPNFTNILDTLKPDLLIHDYLPSWASNVASSLNIPTFGFLTCGAALIAFGTHFSNNKGLDEFPFPEIFPDSMNMGESSTSPSNSNGAGIGGLSSYGRFSNTIIIKSSRELEGKYMDYVYHSFGVKVVSVGPLVPDPVYDDDDDEEGIDIINWLDKKEKSSTVFMSFGSQCYLSKEDVEEMAHGLELSKVNFIWVVRFPQGEEVKLEDALPKGFLERIRERGMVVGNWVPQIKILNHSSIGGFVSHCGWSSTMESMKFGVPIIAMPMQFDQPWNARVLVSSGVGLEVERDNVNGRFKRENVAKVIREVMVESNGEEIRRKAKEMSDNIKVNNEEGMNEVENEILSLCGM